MENNTNYHTTPICRIGLKLIRTYLGLSRKAFSQYIDVSNTTYCGIEKGDRSGSVSFWLKLQKKTGIKNEYMWGLIMNEFDVRDIKQAFRDSAKKETREYRS
jgi:DNA-binding XRE family transcriptional regulator